MNHPLAETATRVTVAPSSDRVEWDAFVEAAPGATFCHLYGWHDIVSRVMHHKPCYLAARDPGGNLHGVLPLVRMTSLAFGVRHVSVPFLNDGGPLGSTQAVEALRNHAAGLADSRGGHLELRARKPLDGTVPSGRKVTVLLDLPSAPDALWSNLPSKLRSQVRRPQKAGMITQFGPEHLRAFYDVWSRNMRDLGTPVLPRSFFEAVAAIFPERFVVGCVYHDGKPVAAGAGFVFRDEFEITWASSLREYSRDAPNMLLYWEFMNEAIERGARVFNFGRCTPGEGTHRFKMQWGGETVPLAWITQDKRDGSNTGPGRFEIAASQVWQRLPVSIANAIGPTVARQLPWW